MLSLFDLTFCLLMLATLLLLLVIRLDILIKLTIKIIIRYFHEHNINNNYMHSIVLGAFLPKDI